MFLLEITPVTSQLRGSNWQQCVCSLQKQDEGTSPPALEQRSESPDINAPAPAMPARRQPRCWTLLALLILSGDVNLQQLRPALFLPEGLQT